MVRRSPRSRSGRGLRHVLVALVVLSACTGSATDATPPPVPDPLLDIAEREGDVDVIVQLAVPQTTAGSWDKAAVARAQRKVLAQLGPRARVLERFGRKLPQIMLRVRPAGLQELRRSPLVVNISLNETDEPTE